MSGRTDLRRVVVPVFLAASAALSHAADWGLPELMRMLSLSQRHAASFVEHRYLSVLDQPLDSSGELLFVPPTLVEKRTLKPKPETLVVDGDRLTLERPDHRRLSVSLEEHPEIAAFVESIRGTLAGDLSTLEKNYTVALDGSAESWRLSLVPRTSEVAHVVTRIRIAGSQGRVGSIDLDFAGGDRSEMRISPHDGP